MAKKVKATDLATAISKYLEEEKEFIDDEVKEVANQISKEAKSELHTKSPKNTGKYAQGWTISSQTKGNSYVKKIWNKTDYRLVHLLEFGHLTRNGTTRVKAQPHVRPTEEKYIEKFEKELSNKIRRGK